MVLARFLGHSCRLSCFLGVTLVTSNSGVAEVKDWAFQQAPVVARIGPLL